MSSAKKTTVFGALFVAAAMALPSVQFVSAKTAPERCSVSIKYLNYQDSQSGDTPLTAGMTKDRIGVNAFSVMGVMPIAGKRSVGVSLLEDSITGASPAYHSSGFPPKNNIHHDGESGASGELRHSVDLELTRYYPQGSVTDGSSYSKESDYVSRSASLQGSMSTEDKNTTLTLGGSLTADTIDPNAMKIFDAATNAYVDKKQVVHETKQVATGIVGVTRVLTKQDIVQYYSEDQRLSAFGAVTPGLKVSKQLNEEWLVDLGIERYEQRDEWSRSGKGDPGVATFNASTIKAGISRQL